MAPRTRRPPHQPHHPRTPHKPVRATKLPLLAPTAGLLAEFLRRWYGSDYRSKLTIIAEIDALYYGLGILVLHGCLLTTHAVATAALDGRLPGGKHLRMLELDTDYTPALELVTSIFARQHERQHYAPDHPLNLLWNTFKAHSPTT